MNSVKSAGRGRSFEEHGGDGARDYLYRREYDSLSSSGKARELLALLSLITSGAKPAILARLLEISDDRVRDAIGECRSIFLTSTEDAAGETIFSLSVACIRFVRRISAKLDKFAQISRKAELHASAVAPRTTRDEENLIRQLGYFARLRLYDKIREAGDLITENDPVLANPTVRSLLGQGYAAGSDDLREKARECFRAADSIGDLDIFGLRAWYHLEVRSGYGLNEAERVCQNVIENDKISDRYRGEFLSKLGHCYVLMADHSTDRVDTVRYYIKSIVALLECLWIGQQVDELRPDETVDRLAKPCWRFGSIATAGDVAELVGQLIDQRHDLDAHGLPVLAEAVHRACSLSGAPIGRLKGLRSQLDAKVRKEMDFTNHEALDGLIASIYQ